MNKYFKEINAWKGILALIILMLHFEGIYIGEQKYFETGYLAVDGFFIFSGFFLAITFDKYKNEIIHPFKLILNKIKKIYPLYLISIFILLLLYIVVVEMRNILNINLSSLISELLLLQIVPIFPFILINGVDWYISAYVFSIFILVSLRNMFQQKFHEIILPMLVIFCYSILAVKFGNLDVHGQLVGFIYAGLIRAIAGMSLGILVFKIKDYVGKTLSNVSLNFAVLVSILAIFYLTFGKRHSNNDFLIILPIAIVLLGAALETTEFHKMFASKAMQLFGDLSIYIFFLQAPVIYIMKVYYPEINNRLVSTFLCLVLTASVSLIAKELFERFGDSFEKIKNSLFQKISKEFGSINILIIFAIALIVVIFMLNGKDLWAESVIEFTKYAQGGAISNSFAGYFTIFPILVGYLYTAVSTIIQINWFEFASICSCIYTLICVISIIKLLYGRVNAIFIYVILFVVFAFIGHPSISSIINITHLGYIPLIIYFLIYAFSNDDLKSMNKINRISYIPIFISIFSKPSFSFLLFIFIMISTKSYKKIELFFVLLIASCLSLYQIILFGGNSNLMFNIFNFKHIFKMLLCSIEALGANIIFIFTFYEKIANPLTLSVISILIGLMLIILIIYLYLRKYLSLHKTLSIFIVLFICILPFITQDYSQHFDFNLINVIETVFSKHKLQYQFTSLILLTVIITMLLNKMSTSTHQSISSYMIKFVTSMVAINFMLCGIYSGQTPTVKEVINADYGYRLNDKNYIYPPLPDWDWNWSSNTINGWHNGSIYSKYLSKPRNNGLEFESLNEEILPSSIMNPRVYLIYSDDSIQQIRETNYWDIFSNNNNKIILFINGSEIEFSKITESNVRYSSLIYNDNLISGLYYDNFTFTDMDGNELQKNKLNFILSYED